MSKTKTKTVYEWALETVTTDGYDDIVDVWHHDDLNHYSDEQIRLVLSGETFTVDFGAAGHIDVRYELALTKRRYECMPTYDLATGEQGDDLLDLMDVGYAYIGNENWGELPAEFYEAPGKVPARYKAALTARLEAMAKPA